MAEDPSGLSLSYRYHAGIHLRTSVRNAPDASIVIAELTHGVARSKLESQRLRSQAFVDDVLATLTVYPVTAEIAVRVGVISGQEAARGITLPFEDLPIGATALQLGFELVTLNARHFELIPNLVVKQP